MSMFHRRFLIAAILVHSFGCGAPPQQEQAEVDSYGQELRCDSPCGALLTSLDGVEAYSNSPNQATGASCDGQGPYGLQYQCVEFARRYWVQTFGVRFAGVRGACNICDLTPSGWTRH